MTGEQKYEEIKQILLNYGFDEVDAEEVVENVRLDVQDFEIGGYRFIRNFKIDEIQTAEMEGDAHMLGFYNAWDIADACPLSMGIIESLQKIEKYEEIGQYLIDNDYVRPLQQIVSGADGYEAHFSPEGENMCEIEKYDYYAFLV